MRRTYNRDNFWGAGMKGQIIKWVFWQRSPGKLCFIRLSISAFVFLALWINLCYGQSIPTPTEIPNPDPTIQRILDSNKQADLRLALAQNQTAESVKAFEACKKKAMSGDPQAEADLGEKYYYGDGVEKDEKEALKWQQKAAIEGNARGEQSLGNMYLYGLGVEKDERKALMWIQKALAQEEPRSYGAMGDIYRSGFGVPVDHVKAIQMFQKGAEIGRVYCQFQLGKIYWL